jgi:RNA polymerase sigma-70 factor, ECF subfamily
MSLLSAALARTWPGFAYHAEADQAVSQIAAREYFQHAEAVCRYSYSIVRDVSEAEDIAQESFVRLLQAIENGKAPTRTLPWLMTVAHHLAMDALSLRPREVPLCESVAEQLADPRLNAEASIEQRQREQQVSDALCRLSAQELRCWTLRAEGLRYREIADVLGIQTGTVATFLVRAASKLSSK